MRSTTEKMGSLIRRFVFRASVMTVITLGLFCFIIQFVSADQKSEKRRERSSDHSQGKQPSSVAGRFDIMSFNYDFIEPTYFDTQRTETKVTRVNKTNQAVDGQWVLKKDIPLSAMVSWSFQRNASPVMKKPLQNLCSEIIAPMTGINILYTNLGLTKCPVKKGVYSFNHLVIPHINVPRTLMSTNDVWATTYEWLTIGSKPILKFSTVVKFMTGA